MILDIDEQLHRSDPLLLEFMTSITATVREQQHISLGNETDISKHVKMVRIYNDLCLLQYCTNPTQPTPFHLLMADVEGLVNF